MVFILRQLFNKSHFTKHISFIFSLNFIFQSWLFRKLNINASTKNWNKSNPTSTDRHFLIKIPPHFSKSLLTIHLLHNEKAKINKTVVKKQTQDSNFSSNNCQQDCNEQDCILNGITGDTNEAKLVIFAKEPVLSVLKQ